ncbi:MAG TPA: ABC transporter substrate-binding protein [Gammaproteobacteria bacterium]|nr:ABC transporter substrate-binding protein [Gammaproteobacteria bacterium]
MPRLLLLLLSLICLPAAGASLVVYASVPPVAEIARQVGGDHVEAHSLLRPGDNPVTFAPTPREMAALTRGRLYLAVGVPFERSWLPRIQAMNPRLEVVRLGPPAQAHDHHHEGLDPHRWNDPLAVIAMAGRIRDALARLDPAHAADYAAGQRRVAERMQALDRDIRQRLADLRQRHFLVYHPAWGHFARRYGLRQLAIQHEGKESSARWLAQLIEQARREGIRLVLVQPQFDRRLAHQVAHAIGARVETLDPLAPDYAAQLRRLAELLAETGR